MKGLWKKDLAILKIQKQFYFIIGIIGIIFLLNGDAESIVGALSYIIMVTALSSIGTLSYDEFENGMPFLLTMPFSKRDYVKEKYLFSFGTTGIAAILFSIVSIAVLYFKGLTEDIMSLLVSGISIYLIACIFIGIMISVQLKYGSEKKQLVAIGIFLLVFGIIFGAKFIIEKSGIGNKLVFLKTVHVNSELLFVGFIFFACIILAILYWVSVKVIENKEY